MEFTNIGKKDKYMSFALPMLIVWRKISQNSDICEIIQVFAIKKKSKQKNNNNQNEKRELMNIKMWASVGDWRSRSFVVDHVI